MTLGKFNITPRDPMIAKGAIDGGVQAPWTEPFSLMVNQLGGFKRKLAVVAAGTGLIATPADVDRKSRTAVGHVVSRDRLAAQVANDCLRGDGNGSSHDPADHPDATTILHDSCSTPGAHEQDRVVIPNVTAATVVAHVRNLMEISPFGRKDRVNRFVRFKLYRPPD